MEAGQNPMTVLPTRLGLSVRAADNNPAGTSGHPGYNQLSTGTAPYQSQTQGDNSFEDACAPRSGAISPAVATCDTASVRSVDTTFTSAVSIASENDGSRQEDVARQTEDEPQDLSIKEGGRSTVSEGSTGEMGAGPSGASLDFVVNPGGSSQVLKYPLRFELDHTLYYVIVLLCFSGNRHFVRPRPCYWWRRG